MPASTEQYLTLPDLLAEWPFKHEPNPQQDIVADSTAWVESYNPFDKRSQDAFNRCKFGIFGSYAYAKARDNHFRVAVDLMNLFFVFDEQSDVASGELAARQAKDIMDALRDPNNPGYEGETILGPMTRDFWRRTLECASHSSAQRFIRNFDEYTDAVRQQAVDRDSKRVRNIDEYLELRRGTIGVRPSFDYFLLPDDIPDEILAHPTIEALAVGSIDMTILANDLYSYNKEQSQGDDEHNLVSVAMREKGYTVQQAMDYIGDLHKKIATKFVEDYENLPQYPEPLNNLVKEYCWGMGQWVTTNTVWSFSGERYFGKDGPAVMVHRKIKLLPKKH